MHDYFPRCQHLTVNGARCTSPVKNDSEFCFTHHYRRIRRARNRRAWLPGDPEVAGPLVALVYMEDHASVMENINLIAQGFAEHSIDHRQVGALTYLMNTALKALNQMAKLEKPRPEEMPTVVTHDDLGDPIAIPAQQPIATQQSIRTQPTTATPESCQPESAQAGEGFIAASADHGSRPTDHVSPSPVSCLLSPDPETLATLTAAAEPYTRPQSKTSIPPVFLNIPTTHTVTHPFSNTCTSTLSATHADSTLAQNHGGIPQERPDKDEAPCLSF